MNSESNFVRHYHDTARGLIFFEGHSTANTLDENMLSFNVTSGAVAVAQVDVNAIYDDENFSVRAIRCLVLCSIVTYCKAGYAYWRTSMMKWGIGSSQLGVCLRIYRLIQAAQDTITHGASIWRQRVFDSKK